MNTVVNMKFGSHLYGLNTPTSDMDFKRVVVPDLDSMFLEGPFFVSSTSTKVGEGKNSKDDVDTEVFSVAKFIDLACKGEMIAVDMLFAPEQFIIQSSWAWNTVLRQRDMFITKNMRAYMGYIKKQVHKYGVKGSRINSLQKSLSAIEDAVMGQSMRAMRIEQIWSSLHLDEYCTFSMIDGANNTKTEAYEVMGSFYMPRSWVSEIHDSLSKRLAEYGLRAKKAADNEGVDWKAVSHAFRACYQMSDLVKTGTIVFPFTGGRRERLLAIKQGQLVFNDIRPELEALYEETQEIMKTSTLAEDVDKDKVKKLLLDIYHEEYFG